MSWEVHALGNISNTDLPGAVSEIINDNLGPCTVDESKTLTYTFKGETLTVPSVYGMSGVVNMVVSLNTETGEFVVSAVDCGANHYGLGQDMAYAILRVQTSDKQVELVPCAKSQYATMYSFGMSASDKGSNTTTRVSLVPLLTSLYYNPNVTGANYAPIVGMYTANKNFASGTAINVDGQNFLCVYRAMFAKL